MWALEFAVLGSAWAFPSALRIIQGPGTEWLRQSVYHTLLPPMLGLSLWLAWAARPPVAEQPPGFQQHLVTYLAVWICCVAADWLQGPYVYALYEAYGYSETSIMVLFVAGYSASGVCSCGIGAVADRFGRKRCCMAFCVLHGLAAILIHWNVYAILIISRILAGAGTAILFSCFECWMVSEHNSRHHFSSSSLSYMFSLKFRAMYYVAVVAGLAAQLAVDSTHLTVLEGSRIYYGGYTVPYDISAALLVVGFLLIASLWNENYGCQSELGRPLMQDALHALVKDRNCRRLCAVVAIFEGSMYIFVSNWTPALESKEVPPPHGLTFALFMMAATCGSSVATLGRCLSARRQLRIILVLCVASFALAAQSACGAICQCLGAFMTFEFCVGWYFPCIGIAKSEHVPERIRGSMYNLFRVPLNALVLLLLLSDLSSESRFAICSLLLLIAVLATIGLVNEDEKRNLVEAPFTDEA
ncbi:unnamed protein product [Effrenium voratum]|uniref:Molybdate-anion transporter n=1 Tax=Effrenium voratum TaxID=2562239 RepID=A0AA36HPR0_9DINO|nr:unnamed protein product [Effrenium voratum]CAJ1427251.1 unnamed protein product [Effrenium voratum]